MSVKIRLSRTGARNEPSYRIVVVDSRKKRDGKYIERIGYYDPKPKEFKYKINEERAIYWINQGAIPSTTVRSFLKRAGILKKIHETKYSQQNANQKAETAENNTEDKSPISSLKDENGDKKEEVSANSGSISNKENIVEKSTNKINVGGE